MTKKQSRKRGFGTRSLSVILSVLMILSVFAVMLSATSLSASAAISYWNVAGDFNNWENSLSNTAYRINGSSGSVTINISSDTYSTIHFKMVAYEDGWKWCGNYDDSATSGVESELEWNDGGENITMNLPSGTTQVTFKIEVKNGKNYLTATANGSGGSGGGPDASQMTFDAPVNTSNSANTADNLFWATATYFDYESDKELTDGWLKPVQAGTHNFNGAQDEWYPFYCFNREVIKAQADLHSDWSEPMYFGNFCDTSNAYDSAHHQGGTDSYGYREATSSYNTTRFKHIVNNSGVSWDSSVPHVADDHTSYQGLVSSQLSSSGDLLLPNGQQAPYFNDSETGPLKGYAKVVNSSFPFKVTDVSGKNYKKYTFNSKNATDNVYFTWNTSNGVTYPTGVNYGAGTTYGVLDGVSRFMYNDTSGYGIFPFNNASNNYKGTKTNANENLNYGFGIKTEMKFRVPAPSSDVNTASDPIYFRFSGDDDLWMYITDDQGNSQLVLDMGGDHKESTGYVNFNTLKATVDKVGTSGASVTKSFTFDYSKTYTMTVFYMERGLIESNCEMEFTMYPAGNQVNVEKEVNTANINHTSSSTQLQDDVASVDSFNFTAYQSDSASGSNTVMKKTDYMDNLYGNKKTNESTGVFPLKNDEEASFLSQFTTNKYVRIAESDPNSGSYLSYSTTWTVSDPLDSTRDTNGSGLTAAKLQLKNPSGEEYEFAQLDYTFINTPKTGSVTVTKTMNSSASSDRNKEFNAKVEISLTGANGTFAPYPLTYSASDKSGTFATDANGNLSSSALLKNGRTLTFNDLPTNAVVKVTEVLSRTEQLLYTPSYPNGNTTVVPDNSTGTIGVTNTPITPDSIKGSVEGTKTINDASYTGDMFKFVLEGLPRYAGDPTNVKDTSGIFLESATVSNGKFGFDDLTFETEGVYRYHVYEDMSYLTTSGTSFDTDFECTSDDYLVQFTVTKGSDNKLHIDSTKYYTFSRYDDGTQAIEHEISSADFNDNAMVDEIIIENLLNEGCVNIEKENQKGEPVSGVTFGVFLVDEDIQLILDSRKSDAEKYDDIMMHIRLSDGELMVGSGETDENGVANISDISIYQDGFVQESHTADADGVLIVKDGFDGYQKYILLEMESDGTEGYSINKALAVEGGTVSQSNVFTFPINGQYDFTFEFVNNQLKNPSTSGIGMKIFKIVGLALAGLSLLALGGYMLFTKKAAKRKTAKRYVK